MPAQPASPKNGASKNGSSDRNPSQYSRFFCHRDRPSCHNDHQTPEKDRRDLYASRKSATFAELTPHCPAAGKHFEAEC